MKLEPSKVDLSVVIPVLNEQGNVEELARRLSEVLLRTGERFEILFVDDGSTDETPRLLKELSAQHPFIRVLRFARNFGQEAAVQAGILRSRGRWIVQSDGDLQTPPEELPKLLSMRNDGYDIIYGIRQRRKDPWHRVLGSRMMMFVMRQGMGIQLPDDISTFRVIEGSLARFIARLPEKRKFFSALATWSGARAASVPVEHRPRHSGSSKYNLGKLLNHTFDLVVGFSIRPLRFIGSAGATFAMAGILFASFRILQKLLGVDIEMGYTSLFAAIVIIGGLQLIALSVIGEYVGRIFIQLQDRPLFRVAEEVGFESEPLLDDTSHPHSAETLPENVEVLQ